MSEKYDFVSYCGNTYFYLRPQNLELVYKQEIGAFDHLHGNALFTLGKTDGVSGCCINEVVKNARHIPRIDQHEASY